MSERLFDTAIEYQLCGSLKRISHNKYVKPRQTNPKDNGKIKHELLIYCIRILTLAYPFQEGGIVERLAGSAEASPIITGLDTPISISTADQNGAEMLDTAMAAETCRGDNTSDWSLHRFIMAAFASGALNPPRYRIRCRQRFSPGARMARRHAARCCHSGCVGPG